MEAGALMMDQQWKISPKYSAGSSTWWAEPYALVSLDPLQEMMESPGTRRLFVTQILKQFECDTFLPEISPDKYRLLPAWVSLPWLVLLVYCHLVFLLDPWSLKCKTGTKQAEPSVFFPVISWVMLKLIPEQRVKHVFFSATGFLECHRSSRRRMVSSTDLRFTRASRSEEEEDEKTVKPRDTRMMSMLHWDWREFCLWVEMNNDFSHTGSHGPLRKGSCGTQFCLFWLLQCDCSYWIQSFPSTVLSDHCGHDGDDHMMLFDQHSAARISRLSLNKPFQWSCVRHWFPLTSLGLSSPSHPLSLRSHKGDCDSLSICDLWLVVLSLSPSLTSGYGNTSMLSSVVQSSPK